MNDNLSILLRARLSETQDTINDINKQIQALSNNKSLEKIKLKIDIDEKELLNISNRIKDIQTQLSKGFNTSGMSTTSTPKILPQLDANEIEYRVTRINNALDRLKVGKDKVFADTRVNDEVTKLKSMLSEYETMGSKSTVTSKDLSLQMDTLRTKVAQVSGEFKNVNKDGYTFTDMLTLAAKKIIIWKVAGDAVFAVIKLLQQIPDIVSKIDASLTEVNKVLDLSTYQMKALAEEAANLGIAYGKTTVEILNSIGSFAKAGLDQETSKQFASLAALLSNIGDISMEVAEKTLIMANAGYQLGNDYKTLNALISQFNELANRNAIEVNTLSEAWQVSASVAKQAKLDIADYNALITVAGSTSQRSGREIGNALRTWLMRLQGVTDGVDTLEEDVSKVDKVLSDLGIQLRKTPTEFRPAMDVITEIAAKYRELGEAGETVKQSELLEALAGKYRANIVAGVLQNFDDISKAIEDQANSFMSAEKENARYMDSIKARTQALKAQWELFASKTLDSGVIKAIVDLGRVLVQILDSGLARALVTITLVTVASWGLVTAISAIGKSTIGTTLGVIALDIAEKGLLATTQALWATLSASPFFWVTAATAVIMGLVKAYDALNVSMSEYQEQVNNSYNKAQSNIEQIKQLKSEYESLASKTELTREEKLKLVDIEHQLNTKFADTTTSIDLQNDSLETNIQKIDKLTKKEAERFQLLNKRAYKASKELLDSQYVFSVNNQAGMVFDSIEDAIEHFENVLKDSTEKGNLVYNERKKVLENLYKEYDAAIDIVSKYEGYESLLNSTIEETIPPTEQVVKQTVNYTKTLEKANKEIDSFQSSAKTLSSAFDTINEGEKLSADTLLDLIALYPEMASQILNANSSKEAGIKLTEALWKIEKERTVQKLEDNKKILEFEIAILEATAANLASNTSWASLLPKEVRASIFGGEDYRKKKAELDGLTKSIEYLKGLTLPSYSTKKSTSSPSPIPYQDISSELIKTYNTQVELDKLQAKSLESQIKTAKAAKDYNKVIELQNKLLANQEKTIEDIKKANDKIHQAAEKMRQDNAQYDTTGWFDRFGNATTEYLNLIKSFEGKTDEASKRQLSNIEKLFSDLQKLKKAWNDNADAIISMNDAIAQTKQNINETIGAISNTIRSEVKEYTKGLEQIMEIEEEAHKNRLDSIKKDKDAFSSYIDHQIDELDRLKASQDYATDVAEIAQEISKLQAEKNKFTLAANSGDLEATVRVNELAEEISKKQKELSKKQSDEEYRRRKQNLQDIKKNYEEEADAKIDAENEKYNAIKNNYNKLTRTIETFTDTSISLNTNMIDNMINDYDNLSKSFTENVRYMAIAFQQQFIDKLTSAKTEITELNKLTGVSTNTSKPSGSLKHHSTLGDGFEKMSDAEFAQYVANKKAWDEGKITQAQRDYNEKLRKKYGIKVDRYSYRDLIGYYKDGGINTQTGIAMLHGTPSKPEFILNTEQMKRLVTNLAFNVAPPKYNIPKTGQKSEIRIDSLITVQGNVTKDTVPAIKNAGLDIVNKLKGLGVVINNG